MTNLEERLNNLRWEGVKALNKHYAECAECQATGILCELAETILEQYEEKDQDNVDNGS
jgi:ferredoxin-like protein FixX